MPSAHAVIVDMMALALFPPTFRIRSLSWFTLQFGSPGSRFRIFLNPAHRTRLEHSLNNSSPGFRLIFCICNMSVILSFRLYPVSRYNTIGTFKRNLWRAPVGMHAHVCMGSDRCCGLIEFDTDLSSVCNGICTFGSEMKCDWAALSDLNMFSFSDRVFLADST